MESFFFKDEKKIKSTKKILKIISKLTKKRNISWAIDSIEGKLCYYIIVAWGRQSSWELTTWFCLWINSGKETIFKVIFIYTETKKLCKQLFLETLFFIHENFVVVVEISLLNKQKYRKQKKRESKQRLLPFIVSYQTLRVVLGFYFFTWT